MTDLIENRRSKVELLRPEVRLPGTPKADRPEAEAAGKVAPATKSPAPQQTTRAPQIQNVFETRRSRVLLRRWRALLFIMLPTLLAAVYCYSLAAPMYVSSVKFSIRGQSESGTSSLLGKLLPNSGSASASAFLDGFSVRDYLSSGDALSQLQKNVNFVSRMQQPKGDFIFRLKGTEPQESMLDFYRRVVSVRFNMAEGIISLDVYAFTPQDAFVLATELTKLAGEFSNDINRRMTDEALRTATEDFKRAERRLADARVALTDWRKKHGNLDVEANAKMYQQIVTQLETQLSGSQNELEELRFGGLVKSPRRKVIEDRIKSLTDQIELHNARMTSSTSGSSVVNLLGEYQRLNLEQEFSAKNYELVSQSLQHAQSVTRVRQKHVAIVVSPNNPEKPAFPDPWKIIPLTFLASIFLYMIGILTASVIRDNQRAA